MNKRLPKYISREDARRLLEAPDWKRTPTGLRNRVAMQLMYRCGLRNSEVCGLSVDDVNLAGRMLHVQSGKGDKDRNVPMSRDVVEWGQRWLNKRRDVLGDTSSPWFVCTLKGGRVNERYIHEMVTREAVASQVYINEDGTRKPVHPHVLRHTFATERLEEGFNIKEVQELLGHESLSTTEIYLHVRPVALAEKMWNIPSME